jgi:stearoyl-CoA desaturase (delta-9 desaturase)
MNTFWWKQLKAFPRFGVGWYFYFGFQILFHLSTIYALVFSGSSLHWLWLTLVGVILFQHIGGEIGAHRYFAHNSFKANPWAEKFMAICSVYLYMGPIIAWAPFHRVHHKYSDTEDDVHSPSHVSLFDTYCTIYSKFLGDGKRVEPELYKDLLKIDILKWTHRNYMLLCFLPFLLCFIDWRIPVYFIAMPSVIMFHVGGLVNTSGHLKKAGFLIPNYRNFDTDDNSHNCIWSNILTRGSVLQNNHHAYPSAYNHKMSDKWYERDDINVFLIEKILKA